MIGMQARSQNKDWKTSEIEGNKNRWNYLVQGVNECK
jgi:hypothetical protein